MVAFHRSLSEQSVRMRHLTGLKLDERTTHERLVGICFTDYDRELALVVERQPAGGEGQIIALGRLSRERVRGATGAEFSLLVSDPRQGCGVGAQLLSRLIDVAKREEFGRIYADILEANLRMQRLCARLGFEVGTAAAGLVRAERKL
jgi:acetyltransferase